MKYKRKFQAMGDGVELDQAITFSFMGRIALGNYVYIGPKCYLNGRGGLHIGDHTIIGPEVVILTSMHNYADAQWVPYDEIELLRCVKIERCVWIGMRAMIMPGVTIGEGSVVGAGSVVTRSCDKGSIIAGNPARLIGGRDMVRYWQLVENGSFYLKAKQAEGLKKIERVDNNKK